LSEPDQICALIKGAGPAACAAALSLERRGIPIHLDATDDTLPPVGLVLEAETVELLVDVFGGPELFEDGHQLRRRVVCWGSGAPSVVPHYAVAMPGAQFRSRLFAFASRRLHTPALEGKSAPTHCGDTVVETEAKADLPGSQFRRFGSRVTLSAEVNLSPRADPSACLIDGRPAGWVFLAPLSDRHAFVQATFPLPPPFGAEALSEILDSSRLIAPWVTSDVAGVQVMPSAPAFRFPSSGRGWLAAGAAAMTLDPLCGDGTGYSVRSGLLAAAALAARDENLRRRLAQHFRDRLRIAFAAHLRACTKYYDSNVFDKSWLPEIQLMAKRTSAFRAPRSEDLKFRFTNSALIPATGPSD
jgi:2-polyprenyl-6-methoxyphenol hydroxylase-like FAD-dependent oxidoreductase